MIGGALDSFGDLDDGLRSNNSGWDDWEFEVERRRPPSEEWIAWVPDTVALVGTDGVETVLEGSAVSVTHVER